MGAAIYVHEPKVTEVRHVMYGKEAEYWVVRMRAGDVEVILFVEDLENFIEPMQCEL